MSSLPHFLNELTFRYHQQEYLSSDPLEFPHRFSDAWDQEAVALISALLAYGKVAQIRRSVEDLLERMALLEESPSAWVRRLSEPEFARRARKSLKGFVHRFNTGEDIFQLFKLLNRSWRENGSLGAHFLKGLQPEEKTIENALNLLIQDWRRWAGRSAGETPLSYLLTAPAQGSCCKRWCMFLRWMGRKDALDLGLWLNGSPLQSTFPRGKALKPRQLVIPLDTHTGRISQYLGLTSRKSVNWLAALEVTDTLRGCDEKDPTRYDFALARLGILDICQKTFRMHICQACDLFQVCHLAQQKS